MRGRKKPAPTAKRHHTMTFTQIFILTRPA